MTLQLIAQKLLQTIENNGSITIQHECFVYTDNKCRGGRIYHATIEKSTDEFNDFVVIESPCKSYEVWGSKTYHDQKSLEKYLSTFTYDQLRKALLSGDIK